MCAARTARTWSLIQQFASLPLGESSFCLPCWTLTSSVLQSTPSTPSPTGPLPGSGCALHLISQHSPIDGSCGLMGLRLWSWKLSGCEADAPGRRKRHPRLHPALLASLSNVLGPRSGATSVSYPPVFCQDFCLSSSLMGPDCSCWVVISVLFQ